MKIQWKYKNPSGQLTKENAWKYLPQMPNKNVYFSAASSLRLAKIFICGGQDSYGVHNMTSVLQQQSEDVDAATDSVWKWIPLKNMKCGNYYCTGLYWDRYDKFLSVGGMTRYKHIAEYDVYKNEWYDLPKSRYSHYMGVCSIWNDRIYWIGDDRKMCNVEMFDKKSNQWISREIGKDLQPPYKKARIWQWI